MIDVLDAAALSHQSVMEKLLAQETFRTALTTAAEAICTALHQGGKVILFGNGGSATDAMHITAEFIGRFERERKALPALCLNDNAAVMTAIANDYGYETVFVRQLEACLASKDVVIGLTTSGKSKNVLEGLKCAKEHGAFTVAFCGEHIEQLDCDCVLSVPSNSTPRIQEMHIFIGHCLAQAAEACMTNGEKYD